MVVLAVGGSLIEIFPAFMSVRVNLLSNLALRWKEVGTPPFLANLVEETGPEFCVALGIAMRKIQNRE